MHKTPGALAALFSLLLGACGTSPQVRYYALETAAATLAQGNAPSVLLVAASLPELLDRPQLVVRGPASQVRVSEQLRWAEPLRSAIPRVVAADLARLLDSGAVAAVPTGAPQFDADFRLTLHVQRLDGQQGRGVDLELLWVLKPRQGEEVLGHCQIHEAESGDGSVADLVGAQRRALGRAAAEIAADIRRLGGPPRTR